MTIEGDVSLDGSEADLAVSFRGATIAGEFSSSEARLHGGQHGLLVTPALDLSSAKIDSGASLYKTIAIGPIQFRNAEIKGDLNCDGAQFDAPFDVSRRNSLIGDSLKVNGDLTFYSRFTDNGLILI